MVVEFKSVHEPDFSEILAMMKAFNEIDDYLFDRERIKNNLIEFVNNKELGRIWIIAADNITAGYIVLTFGFSFEYHGRDAFIDEFFVKDEYRNQGIGKAAIEFASTEAEKLGVNALHLEVESHNERASHLYMENGFRKNSRMLLTKRFG